MKNLTEKFVKDIIKFAKEEKIELKFNEDFIYQNGFYFIDSTWEINEEDLDYERLMSGGEITHDYYEEMKEKYKIYFKNEFFTMDDISTFQFLDCVKELNYLFENKHNKVVFF